MERAEFLLKYADLTRKGVEIAPYFNPTVRKSDGFDVFVMDVFDTKTLRERALNDPWIPNDRIDEIEEVDLVGDASQIFEVVNSAKLEGRINYIVSSHNLEHLPNPILFLQGACAALEPGGVLCLALPDCRACFDHFRMPTRLVDWLAAFHEQRTKPSAEAIFDGVAQGCSYYVNEQPTPGCNLYLDDHSGFRANQLLEVAYEKYKKNKDGSSDYEDAHCSVFFPETFELLIRDLSKLGLINFDILEISETKGLEFFVWLIKSEPNTNISEEEFYSYRQDLMVKISKNLGAAPFLLRQNLDGLTSIEI